MAETLGNLYPSQSISSESVECTTVECNDRMGLDPLDSPKLLLGDSVNPHVCSIERRKNARIVDDANESGEALLRKWEGF